MSHQTRHAIRHLQPGCAVQYSQELLSCVSSQWLATLRILILGYAAITMEGGKHSLAGEDQCLAFVQCKIYLENEIYFNLFGKVV